MATIVKRREYKTCTLLELCFFEKETEEVRWGFPLVNGYVNPCKEGEEPNTYVPCPEEECTWWQNYVAAKENDALYSEVVTHKWGFYEPATAICECGKEIRLNYDAEPCEHCGRLHNLFGQELLPREMWEEEY